MKMLGVYDSAGKAAAAARAIRQAQQGDVVAYSPTVDPLLVDPRKARNSPVRLFTLLGGLVGCAIGIALPLYTMLDLPLVVGGKPIISIPPIVIIAFELSMLCAALGGFLGFLVLGGLPRVETGQACDQRCTDDRFGIVVTCAEGHGDAVRAHLERAGAEEVRAG